MFKNKRYVILSLKGVYESLLLLHLLLPAAVTNPRPSLQLQISPSHPHVHFNSPPHPDFLIPDLNSIPNLSCWRFIGDPQALCQCQRPLNPDISRQSRIHTTTPTPLIVSSTSRQQIPPNRNRRAREEGLPWEADEGRRRHHRHRCYLHRVEAQIRTWRDWGTAWVPGPALASTFWTLSMWCQCQCQCHRCRC
jgi:hypothetical protein